MTQRPTEVPLAHSALSTQHFPVTIIGGGITGLAAAWELQKAGIKYTLLEASDRWGGKIRTETVEGDGDQPFVIEVGPDSVLAQKPWALHLALELGLEDRLLGTNDDQRKTYVLNRGRLTPMPDGLALIVPTKVWPFVTSPLISWPGKLRMGLDWFLPRKGDDADESLADFVRRRLGAEALDKLAEPLLAGIYNTDAERQSLLATFPRFRDIEQQHGSLTRGMIAAAKTRGKAVGKTVGLNPLSERRQYSAFMSFRSGMQELVDSVLEHLTGDLRLNTGLKSIAANPDGSYTLLLTDNCQLSTDNLILSTPAHVTASLLTDLAPVAADLLRDMRYVSTGTMALAYRREDVLHPLDGFGVVIPRSEGRPINAMTWVSTKFDHRAPEGYALIRVFFGGSRTPESFELDDDDLLAMIRGQLRDLLGVEVEPLFIRTYRWREANPQYDVGHLDRIDAIEAALPPGVHVTGSAYRGIGVPDCVHQAQMTAAKVVEHWGERVIE